MTPAQAAVEFHRLVYHHANRYRSDYAEVEDLAQEGFLALFAALNAYPSSRWCEGGGMFPLYASYRIQRRLHRVAAYARRRGVRGKHASPIDCFDGDDGGLHEVLGTAPREEETAAVDEELARLDAALARLSERNRAIVTAVRDGVDHGTIVQTHGISRSRVWQILTAFAAGVRRATERKPLKAKPIPVPPRQRKKTREKGPCIEIVYRGESKRIAAWAAIVGLPHMLVRKRLHAGWSIERALETPAQARAA